MSSKYQIWIEYGKKREQLPVNPEKISFKISGNNKSVNIVDLGEAIIPQAPKAEEISFSSFFPGKECQGMQYAPTSRVMAKYFVTMFIQLMQEKTVIRLVITGCGFVLPCVVDSFDFYEKGGDVGTFYYTVKFKEYRTVKMFKIDTSKGKASVAKKTPSRANTKQVPQTYTVKAGDCLYNIAKKYYGDGSKYTIIRDANKDVISKHGSNPNMIWVGDILTIPKL